MKHYGDITKIKGADVPPVNVIIGGSPCQDLSIAGRRAGLAGERSGLFIEQLRIIKEMRYTDEFVRGRKGHHIRPRFMVWENVPGAFSSNKGEDFGAVLQETLHVVCQEAPPISKPKNGWPCAGCLQLSFMGGQCSVAWRVLDAQFWGVPQRRRRIALVADFGGSTAGEILFERKGVSGYSAQSGSAWKTAPAYAKASAVRNDNLLGAQGGGGRGALIQTNQSAALSAFPNQMLFQPYDAVPAGFNGHKSHTAGIQYAENKALTIEATMPPDVVCMATQQGGVEIRTDGKAPTLTAAAGMSGNNQPVVAMGTDIYNGRLTGSTAASLTTATGQGAVNTGPSVIQKIYCIQGNCIDRADTAGCNGKGWTENVSYALNTMDRPAVVVNSIAKTGEHQNVVAIENHPQDSRVKLSEKGIIQTLNGKMGTGGGNTPMILECFSQDAYDQYKDEMGENAVRGGHMR